MEDKMVGLCIANWPKKRRQTSVCYDEVYFLIRNNKYLWINWVTNEDKKNLEKFLEAMGSFSKGLINETLERHTFNFRKQDKGEQFDDFVVDIKS